MKGVLAISGGVDSMVMLDMLASGSVGLGDALDVFDEVATGATIGCDKFVDATVGCTEQDYIVAHFDHGTRPSSTDDARFVCRRTTDYQKYFFTSCGKLGESAAEETARAARYKFLRETVAENNCTIIYTAHHLDDLVETVAINLLRGTGWRGLAVLDTPGVGRPLLEPQLLPTELRSLAPLDKKAVLKYAAEHKITFRQDPTNTSNQYLRNRVREKLAGFTQKMKLYELWQKQKKLKAEIDELVQELLPKGGEPWQRSWFRDLEAKVALELLRAGTLRAGISAMRPQLEDFRQAILTYPAGKKFNLPQDKLVKLNKETFYL